MTSEPLEDELQLTHPFRRKGGSLAVLLLSHRGPSARPPQQLLTQPSKEGSSLSWCLTLLRKGSGSKRRFQTLCSSAWDAAVVGDPSLGHKETFQQKEATRRAPGSSIWVLLMVRTFSQNMILSFLLPWHIFSGWIQAFTVH